ncbi:uncharacterized protein LOC127642189, partial [Xyrauchen texanus]|uniref:uncharacterized protein LOC127642189 n=1 Tax=Xyrauchen texanus TaxID=154827 RepID=UPI0022427612
SVSLSGLLLILLPLFTQSVQGETVDLKTLAKIIQFFEQNYKRVDRDGHARQYATAINVLKKQCQVGFSPSQNNFLTKEIAGNVKNAIADEKNALYQGTQLIAAGTRNMNKYNMHSESLLLNPADKSPMTNLLNKKKDDSCTVFYTFDSPCSNTCLNEKSDHNIIKALDNWKKHSGIKAFVFKNFWKFDKKDDLKKKFKEIVARVPLYRCVSENVCHDCKGEGNTPIDEHCLPLE